jgi:hypothetical protein
MQSYEQLHYDSVTLPVVPTDTPQAPAAPHLRWNSLLASSNKCNNTITHIDYIHIGGGVTIII